MLYLLHDNPNQFFDFWDELSVAPPVYDMDKISKTKLFKFIFIVVITLLIVWIIRIIYINIY
jgi:hypothetical protein